jgi:sirohydrochlorin cobaltochelatase
MLWEGMGFGWAETGFSGVADPRVPAALDRAARLGFRRIAIFPYFLFTGILVKRIYAAVDEAAARFPEIEFLKVGYFNDHPRVLEAFAERLAEIGVAPPAMNCQLCKYRVQIIGHGEAVGTPQAGHHHHVRGIGLDAHADGHDHEHTHDHGHPHPHGTATEED